MLMRSWCQTVFAEWRIPWNIFKQLALTKLQVKKWQVSIITLLEWKTPLCTKSRIQGTAALSGTRRAKLQTGSGVLASGAGGCAESEVPVILTSKGRPATRLHWILKKFYVRCWLRQTFSNRVWRCSFSVILSKYIVCMKAHRWRIEGRM